MGRPGRKPPTFTFPLTFPRRLPRRPPLAFALVVCAAAVAVVAGCELVVTDTVPAFSCLPGPGNCPAGWTCAEATRQCVRCDPSVTDCADDRADATVDTADGSVTESDGGVGDDGKAGSDHGQVDGAVVDAGGGDDGAVNGGVVDSGGPCRGLTCRCSGGSDCASGICANPLTVTDTVYTNAQSAGFCTRPCCTSADCDSQTVCFGSGAGGNYCVAPEWLGRNTNLGQAVGGATCHGHSDCRSALCASGTCADTCCSGAQSSGQCSAGVVCRIGAFPGLPNVDGGASGDAHATAYCGAPVGTKPNGIPCRNTSDCVGAQLACYDSPTTIGGRDIVATCILSTGKGALGASCQSNDECQSNFCDSNACSDVCFSDSDCEAAAPLRMGWHCRPEMVAVQNVGGVGGGSYSVLCCGR
jgi:hypothetical protein